MITCQVRQCKSQPNYSIRVTAQACADPSLTWSRHAPTLGAMTQQLPGVSTEAGLAACHGNPEFTQVTSIAEGRQLADIYCTMCPVFDACELLAVATWEDFGSLHGVWAGQVFHLDSSHRT